MGRIADKFAYLKGIGRKAFIPYLTAGDPNLETTERLLLALADAGADIIELGVPFSDPMADGPVIQRASERALLNPIGVAEILPVVERVRGRRAHEFELAGTPHGLDTFLAPLPLTAPGQQRGHDEKEESEADVYGFHFMVRHRFDPTAMVSLFKKLPSGGGLMSSHPASPDRAAKIQALIDRKG